MIQQNFDTCNKISKLFCKISGMFETHSKFPDFRLGNGKSQYHSYLETNLQLILGTAEICQLFYLATKNVTINSI